MTNPSTDHFTDEFLKAIAELRGYPHLDRAPFWLQRLQQDLAALRRLGQAGIDADVEPVLAPHPVRLENAMGKTTQSGAPEKSLAAVGRSDAAPWSAANLARRIRAGEVTPTEAVDHFLNRIEQHTDLNAFIAVFADTARREAQAIEERLQKGETVGPLAGVPLAIKDLMHIEGYAMTAGSKASDRTIATHDATVVRRLREAGAIILGATNLHEYAYGITTDNPHFGRAKNPHNPEHYTGGSSGGSAAAVAAGLSAAALGTDTAGSIRTPSACCGIVGLKPTYGRVSRTGVAPLSWSLDHVGPMTWTVEDAALLLEVMAGSDPEDPTSSRQPVPSYRDSLTDNIEGWRIGVPTNHFFDALDPAVRTATEKALAVLKDRGASLVDVTIPTLRFAESAQFATICSEATQIHWERLRKRGEDYGPDVRVRLEMGQFIFATDYVKAQRLRSQLQGEFADVFQSVDALVTPTLPVPSPKAGTTHVDVEGEQWALQLAFTRLTFPMNLAGLPAVTLPSGKSHGGLPLAVQVVGPAFGEGAILNVASVLEESLNV